jgi:hypothetical protein
VNKEFCDNFLDDMKKREESQDKKKKASDDARVKGNKFFKVLSLWPFKSSGISYRFPNAFWLISHLSRCFSDVTLELLSQYSLASFSLLSH